MPAFENGDSENYVDERASLSLPTYDSNGFINNDQGPYKNLPIPINSVPRINMAYLANNKKDLDEDVTINLNTMSLTWYDFINIFYELYKRSSIERVLSHLVSFSWTNSK